MKAVKAIFMDSEGTLKNKNNSIMEFYPANVSYNLVNTFVFRTSYFR